MTRYPALDVRAENLDLLYARLDDFSPTAIEEREDGLRAFFSSAAARETARNGLAEFAIASIDVADEDWARRSQEHLAPVTVGRITVVPDARLTPSGSKASADAEQQPPAAQHVVPATMRPIVIVIKPSMGFGTGHHATTRLCLAALQEADVDGRTVLDVGTGSGILAIAADRLGAARARGFDVDPDAIEAARENLELNPSAIRVDFAVADLASADLEAADIVMANLTGALLERSAAALLAATRTGGLLILSGLMATERDRVCRAFAGALVIGERHEDEWVALTMKKT